MLVPMARSADTAYRERLGVALDAAMYFRGHDETAVAALVGVDRATIYRWLNGHTAMSAGHAARLAEVLDAPSDLFLRPPETRERALSMMAAWDELRAADPPPSSSLP
jgi:transcriptional regulator with XRE-family HTH domain